MKSFFALAVVAMSQIVVFLGTLTSAYIVPSPAFVTTRPSADQQYHHSLTLLKLRPCQAADLEAYAYDLMKSSAGGEKKKRTPEEHHSLKASESGTCPSNGPLAWCRRVLWHQKSTAATSFKLFRKGKH